MQGRGSNSTLSSVLLPVALFLVPVVLFWNAFTLRGMFYYGDIVQLVYPLKVAFSHALAAGQFPLWSADVMAGYPLHAEGEGGFLYPLSLGLSLLMSPEAALNYQVLLHLAIAGLGMYAYGRTLRLDALSAAVGGALYMLSGFVIAHLNHLNVLSVAAWLPVLFAIAELMMRKPRVGRYTALLALVVGLQFLAGHMQVSILSLLALGLYILFKGVLQFIDGEGLGRPATLLGAYIGAVLLGAGLAAPQLLPTWELTTQSVRAGGLSGEFFTSFSFPPTYVLTFFLPFLNGNPLASLTPATAVEWCGYVGILPLILAFYALVFRRDHYSVFFVLLAVLSLFLALGEWNPLYHYLQRVPGFNFFRVPARFLYLYTFSLATLAALGFHSLRELGLPSADKVPRAVPAVGGLALLLLWGLALNSSGEVDQLITLWQFLPWVLLVLGLALVVIRGRAMMGTTAFSLLAVALVGLDLYAFSAVFSQTFNATIPLAEMKAPPGVLAVLNQETEPYRVYTSERITPVQVGVRESLFADFALVPGVPSLSGYVPLMGRSYKQFVDQLPSSAKLADLANVKYLLVPQSVGDDPATLRANVQNPFVPSPVDQPVQIPPTPTTKIVVESFLSHSPDIPDGETVAEVVVGDGKDTQTIPLRVGIETAEWAYDRPDVRSVMKHQQATVARQWPASSIYQPREHLGYTYTATLPLAREMQVTSVEVRTVSSKAFVYVDRMELVGRDGKAVPLGHLAGGGDYEMAYWNEAVAAFRNRDAMPRAFVVHQTRTAANEDEAWSQLLAADFDPRAQAVLGPNDSPGLLADLASLNPFAAGTDGPASEAAAASADGVEVKELTDGRVVLQASLTERGFVVLSDAYFPGWHAYVDGSEATIMRADWLFRAVEVPAGEHEIEMRYEPSSMNIGWLMGGLAMLAT
ncbi:MAG: YfhO family protein, partial [Dehalococcoidales bacterium]|nr:YfhO family protein [Dehalococcoidales bacterium]